MARTGAALLALAALAAAQERVTILGRVVDADGRSVAEATAAAFWERNQPVAGVTTDAEGRFSLPVDYYGRGSIGVILMDKERRRGAVSIFSAKSFGKEREIEIEGLHRVTGKFTCGELGAPPPWTNVYVIARPGNALVAQYGSDEAEFSLVLPPGDYELHMYGMDVKDRREELFLDEDKDFGAIDLAATNLAKLYGKPAPRIKVTAARGVKSDVQLADFKGRYVLLEFWGFW